MGVGLGKNSPVVLTLGKENYEALINRHGQFIRWRTATKCPCAVQDTGQPDIHCKRCKGRGEIYGFQAGMTVTETLMVDISGVVEVSEEFEDCTLDFAYDFRGVKFTNAVKTGRYITLNSETPLVKGTYVYIVMLKDTVKKLKTATCEKIGAGYYRVNGLRSRKNGIDGLYHTAPADIIKIEKVIDGNGIEYKAKEYRTDIFFIQPAEKSEEEEETPEITEPITAHGVEYIPPFVFAIQHQEMSKADREVVNEAQGEAMVTFPYSCDVADGDILTVLSGTVTKKEVKKRTARGDDTIGSFFVQEVVSCLGVDREYFQGKDFMLIGTNCIKWLCEDSPEEGENYSITYKENPTYVVAKSIPQLRTSENQRLPKKAVLKWYTTYADKKGVNVQ